MTKNTNIILDVDSLLNTAYDRDTIASLYQIWHKLPPCQLLGTIGDAIQDLQFYKEYYEEQQKITELEKP